ncbi:hypothetical protein D3C80_2215570 [compost metagenome]
MIKGLKELYPGANIAAIDYDAGVSVVNQANRIKLMMSIASELVSGTSVKPAAASLIQPSMLGTFGSGV